MKNSQEVKVNKQYTVLKNIFNRDFVVSAIIPIIIFLAFNKVNMTFMGIVLSAVWSIGVVLVSFIKERRINALASMAGIFSFIGLIGTVISKNPTFYLISPIVQDILYALIFFGSLFFERSLIQVIVEQSYFKNDTERFRRKAKYKKTWMILTVLWALLNVSQAIVRIILLHSVSVEIYYSVSILYSNISTPLLIAFSIFFPKWYWKQSKSQLS